MKETKGHRVPAWDCKFYKDDSTCAILTKMVCREKACKFRKGIGLGDVLHYDVKECESRVKPCVCGGKPTHIKSNHKEHIIRCDRCGRETKVYASKQNALIAWEKGRIQWVS